METFWENAFGVSIVVAIVTLLFAAGWVATHTSVRHIVVAVTAVVVAFGFFFYSGEQMNDVRGNQAKADRAHVEDLYDIDLPDDFNLHSTDPQVVGFDDGDRLCVVSWKASISGTPPPRLKCADGNVTEPPHAD